MKFIKDSYVALAATHDIQEIAKPLNDFLGTSSFCFHKWFPNGKEICLSNNATWVKHVHQNNFSAVADVEALGALDLQTILWPFENKTKMIKDIREIWDCSYGISFFDPEQRICFAFSIKGKKDTDTINTYLNNIEQLKRFCQFFQERAQPIIKAASQDAILSYKKVVKKDANQELLLKINKFIAETQVKKYYSGLDNIKEVALTLREIDCLKLLLKGYTALEISSVLNISKRTVETHLENIKNKTGFDKKSDLIKFIFSNNIDKYL